MELEPIRKKDTEVLDGQWQCPECTLVNEKTATNCSVCNAENPNPRSDIDIMIAEANRNRLSNSNSNANANANLSEEETTAMSTEGTSKTTSPPPARNTNNNEDDGSPCMDSFLETVGNIWNICEPKYWAYCCGAFCCFGCLLIVILVPISVKALSHNEYGILYDKLTNEVDNEEIFGEGNHVLTPASEFFKYKKTIQSYAFDTQCLTLDGIIMDLNLDLQFQVIKNELFSVFWDFGEQGNLDRYIRLIIEDSILDTCGDFVAGAFYEFRSIVENAMEANAIADFLLSDTHATIVSLNLNNYEFPTRLQNAITDKQETDQDIAKAVNERAGALVQAETVFLTTEVAALSTAIAARAEADSILIEGVAEARSIEQVWLNRLTNYVMIQAAMNMNADEFVYEYLTSVVLQHAVDPITHIE
jgi:hypothetical protein